MGNGVQLAMSRENEQTKLLSVRFRKELLRRLDIRAVELDVPNQTLLQGLVSWSLDLWDQGKGPTGAELMQVVARKRPGRPPGKRVEAVAPSEALEVPVPETSVVVSPVAAPKAVAVVVSPVAVVPAPVSEEVVERVPLKPVRRPEDAPPTGDDDFDAILATVGR